MGCTMTQESTVSGLSGARLVSPLQYLAGDENTLPDSLADADMTGMSGPELAEICAAALVQDRAAESAISLIHCKRLPAPPAGTGRNAWPWSVRIYTLGGLLVHRDDVLSEGPALSQRPQELLLALIAMGGRSVNVDQLADVLWPELEGDAAYKTICVNLHRLRKAIGPRAVKLQGKELTLDAEHVWVDVWELERKLGEMDRLSRMDSLEEPCSLEMLQSLSDRVLALHQGSFLGSDTGVWALGLRERLQSKCLRILGEAGGALEAGGDKLRAMALYGKGLQIDQFAEELYIRQMKLHIAQGQKQQALTTYRRCCEIFKEHLGVEPSPECDALYLELISPMRPLYVAHG